LANLLLSRLQTLDSIIKDNAVVSQPALKEIELVTSMPTRCQKCGSYDCSFNVESLGKAIRARIVKTITFCNTCTYTKAVITIADKEIFTETKLPDSDETELECKFLARMYERLKRC